MCKTLSLLPLGFFRAGSGLGFGLANQPVRFNGDTGGRGQTPTKFWQSICVTADQPSIVAARHRSGTHLSIEPTDVCVRNDLRDHRPEPKDAEFRVAVAVEVEAVAERDGECGADLGRSHRDKLADLERSLALGTFVPGEDGVVHNGFHLFDSVGKQ